MNHLLIVHHFSIIIVHMYEQEGKILSSRKIRSFSLPEMLLTLGIISFICTMTIPPLIINKQKSEALTKFKKAYSDISNALKMAEVENGPLSQWDFTASTNKTLDFADNYLYKYLNIEKKCTFNEEGCWKEPVSLSNTSTGVKVNNTRLSAITKSGYSIFFWISNTGNSSFIYIDIDGPNKGQGMLGKDIFILTIYFASSGVKPELNTYGLSPKMTREEITSASPGGCRKNYTASMAGAYCSSLIILDGWQIKDDYPW